MLTMFLGMPQFTSKMAEGFPPQPCVAHYRRRMTSSASVGFGELNRRVRPGGRGAAAQIQIIGLSGRAVISDTAWRGGGSISQRNLHSDLGAAVEIRSEPPALPTMLNSDCLQTAEISTTLSLPVMENAWFRC